MCQGLLCVLLSAAMLAALVAIAICMTGGEEESIWPQRKVPVLQDRYTTPLGRTLFTAQEESKPRGLCGTKCQGKISEPSLAELEMLLSYETMSENGTRTLTTVSLHSPIGESEGWMNLTWNRQSGSRHRREVYGTDGRFTISDSHFSTSYPFCTAVKISSGCSGILLSPRHVLTAAHCIHDGQDYMKSARKLQVGILKLRSRHSGWGQDRSQKRGGSKTEDDRRGGKEEGKGVKPQRRSRMRARDPSFQWIRVKQMQIPKGWFRNISEVALDYDYALLELKQPQKQCFMDMGFVPSVKKLPKSRIHFSGFDDDRAGQLVYRFCSVLDESHDLLYQYCDAQSGATGSGVYMRLKEPGKNKWKRKIIGVFSGHRWQYVSGIQHDYNVAVRITPAKYAQLCHWIHGKSEVCQKT